MSDEILAAKLKAY